MAKKGEKLKKQRNPNGMGSFRKRSDGRIEWRQQIDGEKRSVSGYTMDRVEEKRKSVAGLPVVAGKTKVSEWFDTWLENYVKPLKKAATYNQYRDIYKKHIEPAIGHRIISKLKPVDIQTVVSKMNSSTRKVRKKVDGKISMVDTGERLSTWTMKHARKVMNIAFQKAYDEKLIPVNPVQRIEIPTKQAKIRKVLMPDDLKKIFEAMQNSRWIWSVRFDLVTGMRRGELLALRWSDVDFKNKTITVDESNSSTGIGDTKSSKAHQVPLSDRAILYLEEQKKQLKKEHNPILYNKKLKKADLVFPSKEGVMLQPGSYYTMLARYAKKAGIKASPHCLRHSFVYYTRGTLTLKDLQLMLGHEESTTTLDIYGDILSDNNAQNAAQIDSAFSILEEEVKTIKKKAVRKTKKEGNVIEVNFGKAT